MTTGKERRRRSRLLHVGDELAIERTTDGRAKHGTFIRENEFYVTIRGRLGHEILIPRDKIMQITVVQRLRRREEESC